jgi:AbrB family looped-hinge helix DNA binding protein
MICFHRILLDSATSVSLWHNVNVVPQKSCKAMSKVVEVNIGKQGRLVIPAELRKSLGLHEGDKLVAREESGRLVLEKRGIIEQRVRARFAHISKDRSIVDEFIAERREAAKIEAKG